MVIAQFLSNWVVGIISATGYLGVFLFMGLESANIPIPSEIIMPFAGYLVYQGKFTLLGIAIAGGLGNLAGSVLSYYLGAYLGRPFLLKYGKYILIPQKKFETAESWFQKYGHEAVFLGRFLPVVRTFISLPAGIARMDMKKFVLYTVIGSLIWSALLGYVGIWLGPNWNSIIAFFEKIDIVVIAGFAVFVVWYVRSLRAGK